MNENYWREYHDFWDKFVKDWFEQCPNEPLDEVSQAYKRCVGALNFDELPEPYYGTPEKGVKAVIINLNPGMSQTDERDECLERQKFYSLKDTYRGDGPFVKRSLVKEFVDSCNTKYSEFVHKWSCLNSKYRCKDTDLCGVEWWQGKNPKRVGGKRMPWLSRIYQNPGLVPERVFALELCPYHSRTFSFRTQDKKDKETLSSFINQHVIVPAVTAVVENNLPFAVAIGRTLADILDSGLGSLCKEWSYKSPIEGWPLNDGLQRTYRLYDVKAQDGQLGRVIVTWAVNNRGIPAPGVSFATVEKMIHGIAFSKQHPEEMLVKIVPKSESKADIDTCQCPNNKNVQLLSMLKTLAQFMGKESDSHNCQLFLWQSEGVKLFLRLTKNKPHVTFNFSVADKQAFVDQYGEILRTWGETQGFKVFFGKEHSVGNGLQFKPIRPIDLDGVNCNVLQKWSDMIIAKAKEILK